jgi:hypothetical protein
VCANCEIDKPLVFYGTYRNVKLKKFLEGWKSLKAFRKAVEKNPVLCLNCAELLRNETQ